MSRGRGTAKFAVMKKSQVSWSSDVADIDETFDPVPWIRRRSIGGFRFRDRTPALSPMHARWKHRGYLVSDVDAARSGEILRG